MRMRVGLCFLLLSGLAAPVFAEEPEPEDAGPAAPAHEQAGETGETGESTAKAEEGTAEETTAEEAKAEGSGEGKAEEAKEEEKEEGVSYTLELASATSYVWRGDLLSTSRLEPVFQPSAEVSVPGLGPGTVTGGVWMSRALTQDAGVPDTAWEFDVYASYTVPIDMLELKLGYIAYLLPEAVAPDSVDAQHELSVVGKLNLGSPVSPYLGIHVDPIRLKGFYGVIGGVHSITVMDLVEVVTTMNFGVSSYAGLPFNLQDFTLSSNGSVPIGDLGFYASLTVGVGLSGRAAPGEPSLFPYAILGVGYSP